MSENYFYSSLSGQEIEDTLLGSVRFDKGQTLSTSQMATARANIGAGSENTGFVILGYFDTLQDLQEWLQIPPKAGDAYGIGVAPPYNIYVWDDANHEWVDNGTLDIAEFIDDSETSPILTWSSQKISTELSGKQDTLGDGDISTNMLAAGAVTRAKLANDALFSPVGQAAGGATYTLTVSDLGKTFWEQWNNDLPTQTVTFALTGANSADFPVGSEIAISRFNSGATHITFSGVRVDHVELGAFATKNDTKTVSIPQYGMVALKKFITNSGSGDLWLLTGNVEVVT